MLSDLQTNGSSYKILGGRSALPRIRQGQICWKTRDSRAKLGYNQLFEDNWPPFCILLHVFSWNTILAEANSKRAFERRTIVERTCTESHNNYESTATKAGRIFFCGFGSFLTLPIIRMLDHLGQACGRSFQQAFFLDLRKRFRPSREWMLAVGNRKEGCGSHSQAGSV